MSDHPDPAPARPRACMEQEHRQFDFWLGSWEVRTPNGTLAGHNRITRVAGGCALREEWRGASGLRGTSLNAWSATDGAWHQTWIDASGTVLFLVGGLRDGSMVMEGTLPGDDGAPVRQRISWSRDDGDPDRVRQHWQASPDGERWETVFDGRYVRRD